MAKIRLSPTALLDLQQIKEYIEKTLSNPIAANNTIKRIIKDYSLLEQSPFMGVSLSTKVSFPTDYRFLISGKYIIFYKIDEEFVSIYRILYGKRDYLKVIFKDKIKE